MPDLSAQGLAKWLGGKSAALRDAVTAQAGQEDWTADHQPPVLAHLVEAGSALEALQDPSVLTRQPSLDYLREVLMYVSAPRRLQIIEHLDQIGRLHEIDFGVFLLEAVTAPPGNRQAGDGIRVVADSMRNLHARQLLREIFAPDRLAFILHAIMSSTEASS